MGSYTVTLCRVVHDEVPGVAAGGRGSARRSHHVEAGARADEGGIRRAEGGDQGRGSSITRTWARCCVPCSRRRGRRQRAGEARRAVVDVEAERQRWTIKRLRLKEAGQRRAVSGRRAWMGAREWQLGGGGRAGWGGACSGRGVSRRWPDSGLEALTGRAVGEASD